MSSASEDDGLDNADLDDDLFGDEAGGGIDKARELSDRELDSGDDENRHDRTPEKANAEEIDSDSGRDARILDSTVWRHPLPKPLDGEYNALRLPKFLGIEPRPFDPDTFEIPISDHHTNTKSATFSASLTADTTMRYRKDPVTGKLKSNAAVYKWSDGSTTIAVGDQHYELQTNPLAPEDSKTYQEVQDSHSYFASPSIASQLLVMVGHMKNQYSVRPNKDIEYDALEKLQRSLAAATRGGHKGGDDKNGPELITNTQDPELQKKRAELAEKERMRAQRRRETAAEKANLPSGRRGAGGLSVDDLEGRSGRRAPGSGRKPPSAKRPRRRAEYDSDDDLPRGRHREDEYDKEDDFLASSDEDLEVPDGDDDDEEEILDDETDRDEPKAKKLKSSKQEELSDTDADAEADLEDDEEAPAAPAASEPAGGRGRKRNVIEDDDDE